MQVNVRDDNEDSSVERIIFGEGGECVKPCLHSSDMVILNDPETDVDFHIYTEEIDFLIKALKRAKEEWG